jgi:predicted anti-sigma-YlaC factor YlaD
MTQDDLKALIHTVFASQDEEILCSEFFEQLPRYVDLETSGRDATGVSSKIAHHIQQCPECQDLYQALSESMTDETHCGSEPK